MKKEIELKYLIRSKSDFELFELFLEPYASGEKSVYAQENCYFDTPCLHLKQNGMSLRLRKQNDVYWLSAKLSMSKKKPKKNLSVRLEYEGILENSIAHLIKKGYLSPIDAFLVLPSATTEEQNTKNSLHRHMKKAAKIGLQMIGSFCNLRTKLPINLLGHTLELEFDHSTYPKSIEVFEIEIEFHSEKQVAILRPAVEHLFRAAGIKTYQSSSKSARLYKLLYG